MQSRYNAHGAELRKCRRIKLDAGYGFFGQPLKLVLITESQPRRHQVLLRVSDEVRHGVTQSQHHRDVEALLRNGPEETSRF